VVVADAGIVISTAYCIDSVIERTGMIMMVIELPVETVIINISIVSIKLLLLL
jgi:hypothetical protein